MSWNNQAGWSWETNAVEAEMFRHFPDLDFEVPETILLDLSKSTSIQFDLVVIPSGNIKPIQGFELLQGDQEIESVEFVSERMSLPIKVDLTKDGIDSGLKIYRNGKVVKSIKILLAELTINIEKMSLASNNEAKMDCLFQYSVDIPPAFESQISAKVSFFGNEYLVNNLSGTITSQIKTLPNLEEIFNNSSQMIKSVSGKEVICYSSNFEVKLEEDEVVYDLSPQRKKVDWYNIQTGVEYNLLVLRKTSSPSEYSKHGFVEKSSKEYTKIGLILTTYQKTITPEEYCEKSQFNLPYERSISIIVSDAAGVGINFNNVDQFKCGKVLQKPVIVKIQSIMKHWDNPDQEGYYVGCFEVLFRIKDEIRLAHSSMGPLFRNNGSGGIQNTDAWLEFRGTTELPETVREARDEITCGKDENGNEWIDWFFAYPIACRKNLQGWIEVLYGFHLPKEKNDFSTKMSESLHRTVEDISDLDTPVFFYPFRPTMQENAKVIEISPANILNSVLAWEENKLDSSWNILDGNFAHEGFIQIETDAKDVDFDTTVDKEKAKNKQIQQKENSDNDNSINTQSKSARPDLHKGRTNPPKKQNDSWHESKIIDGKPMKKQEYVESFGKKKGGQLSPAQWAKWNNAPKTESIKTALIAGNKKSQSQQPKRKTNPGKSGKHRVKPSGEKRVRKRSTNNKSKSKSKKGEWKEQENRLIRGLEHAKKNLGKRGIREAQRKLAHHRRRKP